ncbi:MAG TPA: cob(I)yrinic acid a,c-diamide adenosyltransferase [Candidatus Binatus sp.]|nr:cob(I)yrinic acid a,c-diamide adenosyltransferase [Candidatus Binatus sp.]
MRERLEARQGLYTRTGDKGETGLFSGRRVGKETQRVEAYGTVDELNSHVGVARALVKGKISEVDRSLAQVQRDLFVLGGDLASDKSSPNTPRIGKADIDRLEQMVDTTFAKLPKLTRFILPNGGIVGSQLQVARAVCRRAERMVVALSRSEEVNPEIIRYLNRLSTLLFDLARLANKLEGFNEEEWVRE